MNILYIRAETYDKTPAIPRALIAGKDVFNKYIILSWNRDSTSERSLDTIANSSLFVFNKQAKRRSLYYLILTFKFQYWAFKHMLQNDFDVIQALDIESMIPSVLAVILKRKKLIYDMRDPIAIDMRAPSHILNLYGTIRGHLLDNTIYAIDWILMAFADKFILPNIKLIKYLGRWGRKTDSVLYIPNTCYDYNYKLENNILKLNVSNNRIVRLAYLGCMAEDRGSKILIDLCNNNPETVELYIAGNVKSESDLIDFEKIPNITYLGQLNYYETLSLIKQVDAIPILYNPGIRIHKTLLPTKFYESMMAGTPVIVAAGMDLLVDLIINNNLGYIVDYGDQSKLKEVIMRISINKKKYAKECRQYFLSELELTPFLENYKLFYLSIKNSK